MSCIMDLTNRLFLFLLQSYSKAARTIADLENAQVVSGIILPRLYRAGCW